MERKATWKSWVEKRLQKIGIEGQQALADRADLSLKTVNAFCNRGPTGMNRSTKSLIALALRTTRHDLERLAKGEVTDVAVLPSIEGEPTIESAVVTLKWLSRVSEDTAYRVAGRIDTTDAVRIMQIMCGRLSDVYGPVNFAGDDAPNRPPASTPGAAPKQGQPNEQ